MWITRDRLQDKNEVYIGIPIVMLVQLMHSNVLIKSYTIPGSYVEKSVGTQNCADYSL